MVYYAGAKIQLHRQPREAGLTTSALGAYLVDSCERHNLSMREASLRAGLSDATISVIVRRGDDTTPRPETLQTLARTLDGDFQHMMRLAGHLPPAPQRAIDDERLQAKLQRLTEVLSRLPPDLQARIMEQAILLAEVVDAAYRRSARDEGEPDGP